MIENNYTKRFLTLCRNKANDRHRISDIYSMHEKTETEICNAVKSKSILLFLAAHEVIEYCESKGIP